MSYQLGSTLLQLPAEVRVLILRNLLVHDGPLSSLSGVEDMTYFQSIQRSSQILRTCQLLYREGSTILYEENTLCIDFMVYEEDEEDTEENSYFCCILNMYLPVPKLKGKPEDLLTLLEYATPARCVSRDNSAILREGAESLRRMWYILEKFTRLEVRLQYATQPIVFSACRLLRK